jgi:hypothetical protein
MIKGDPEAMVTKGTDSLVLLVELLQRLHRDDFAIGLVRRSG